MTNSINRIFAVRLKMLMLMHELRPQDLASLVQAPLMLVLRWLEGTSAIGQPYPIRLARVFGTSEAAIRSPTRLHPPFFYIRDDKKRTHRIECIDERLGRGVRTVTLPLRNADSERPFGDFLPTYPVEQMPAGVLKRRLAVLAAKRAAPKNWPPLCDLPVPADSVEMTRKRDFPNALKLRLMMTARGYSEIALAALLRHQNTDLVHAWLTGKKAISYQSNRSLSVLFGVPETALCGGKLSEQFVVCTDSDDRMWVAFYDRTSDVAVRTKPKVCKDFAEARRYFLRAPLEMMTGCAFREELKAGKHSEPKAHEAFSPADLNQNIFEETQEQSVSIKNYLLTAIRLRLLMAYRGYSKRDLSAVLGPVWDVAREADRLTGHAGCSQDCAKLLCTLFGLPKSALSATFSVAPPFFVHTNTADKTQWIGFFDPIARRGVRTESVTTEVPIRNPIYLIPYDVEILRMTDDECRERAVELGYPEAGLSESIYTASKRNDSMPAVSEPQSAKEPQNGSASVEKSHPEQDVRQDLSRLIEGALAELCPEERTSVLQTLRDRMFAADDNEDGKRELLRGAAWVLAMLANLSGIRFSVDVPGETLTDAAARLFDSLAGDA